MNETLADALKRVMKEQKGYGYLIPDFVDKVAFLQKADEVFGDKLTFDQFMMFSGFLVVYVGGLTREERESEIERLTAERAALVEMLKSGELCRERDEITIPVMRETAIDVEFLSGAGVGEPLGYVSIAGPVKRGPDTVIIIPESGETHRGCLWS